MRQQLCHLKFPKNFCVFFMYNIKVPNADIQSLLFNFVFITFPTLLNKVNNVNELVDNSVLLNGKDCSDCLSFFALNFSFGLHIKVFIVLL